MDKTAIVQDAEERLAATQAAVDHALTCAVRLMETLVLARRDLDLPAVFGDEAFLRASGLIAALAEAQRETVGTHGALDRAQAWMGVKAPAPDAAPAVRLRSA